MGTVVIKGGGEWERSGVGSDGEVEDGEFCSATFSLRGLVDSCMEMSPREMEQ